MLRNENTQVKLYGFDGRGQAMPWCEWHWTGNPWVGWLVMCRLLNLKDDTMIVLWSKTKLPDSSNPLSDIVGAVQYWVITILQIKPICMAY